ncbi:MAG: ABC transporter permease [Anaerolineaceae bacterium]|jgi:putative spermidine/putrescine transport system permease protein
MEKLNRILLIIFSILILIFVLSPIFVLIISSFNESRYFEFPPTGFTFEWYKAFYKSEEYQKALLISLRVALTAAGIGLLAGVPAAFALDRYKFKGNAVMQSIFLSPLMLPQIIWALGLIQFFSIVQIGGRSILGSFAGIVLAHSVIILPYVIRMVLTSLKYVEVDLESAAMSLGAKPIRTFLEVTIPIILPGVLVSAVFGFMVSFTDVVVSSFVAGTRYITFPVRMYSEIRTEGLDPLAVTVSAFVVIFIVIIAMIGERTAKWSRFF